MCRVTLNRYSARSALHWPRPRVTHINRTALSALRLLQLLSPHWVINVLALSHTSWREDDLQVSTNGEQLGTTHYSAMTSAVSSVLAPPSIEPPLVP